MSLINESFQNIKGIKLYGWEHKFLSKIDTIYEEETVLVNQCELRSLLYQRLAELLQIFMPILVYGLYIWNGNSLDLGQFTITSMMMNKLKFRLQHATRMYREIFVVEEAMTRLNHFYKAPEVQKNLIDKKAPDHQHVSEFALRVQGSFSWGITSIDKEARDKYREKVRKERESQGTPIAKLVRKILPAWREEVIEVPLEPRSLDQMLNLKRLDLSV